MAARSGVEQVVIWLDGRSPDDRCREIDTLAASLLG